LNLKTYHFGKSTKQVSLPYHLNITLICDYLNDLNRQDIDEKKLNLCKLLKLRVMSEHGDIIWQVHTLRGLGPIKFSMSRSQVDRFSADIGSIQAERSDTVESQQAGLEDLYKVFSDLFNDEDFKTVSEAIVEFGPAMDDRVVEFRTNGLSFEYTSGRLTEIFVDENCKKLTFMNIPVFLEDPVTIIKKLSRSLKEQPLIYEQEVIFPEHKMYLFSFVEEIGSSGQYQAGPSFHRSMSWRDSVRPNSVELSEYHLLDLDRLVP